MKYKQVVLSDLEKLKQGVFTASESLRRTMITPAELMKKFEEFKYYVEKIENLINNEK